jgi:hypothetical protein
VTVVGVQLFGVLEECFVEDVLGTPADIFSASFAAKA